MNPANVVEGTAPFGEWETWYRVTGDLSSPKTPLVVAHGGPGATHDYVLSLVKIAETGRPVIHYDQLGNGRSTRLPDQDEDFWTVDLFLAELDNLLVTLGLQDRYCLLASRGAGCSGRSTGSDVPPD
jgi:L-proline amide hydrolase